jgi:hypothetical protein
LASHREYLNLSLCISIRTGMEWVDTTNLVTEEPDMALEHRVSAMDLASMTEHKVSISWDKHMRRGS